MYRKSADPTLLKVFPRNTRGSVRKVFKTAGYEDTLYKRSPFFVGARLWDTLSAADIDLPDIFTFKARLKRQNNAYVDLLA